MKSKALLLIVVMSQLTCHQVIFHAPPGSEMACERNPIAIAAFNGVSVITCFVMEATGTPVADGTVVQFFTDLGRIPEQGKTNDGVVRVNLQADGRSGVAHVSAISGGGSLPAPSSSSVTVTTTPVQRGVSASKARSPVSLAGVMASDNVEVTIGNANAQQIQISANPPRITESRSSQIVATVFDGFGNPVAGVPVFFGIGDSTVVGPSPTPTATPTATPTPAPQTNPGGTGTESLDSQGTPIFTDTNGRATDVLRTRWPREAQQRSVTVTVTVPVNRLTGEVTVVIN
jgi:hypothetical protein